MNIIKRFIKWLFKDCDRTDCRCCGNKLHQPGGYAVRYIGPGFCARCYIELQKNF